MLIAALLEGAEMAQKDTRIQTLAEAVALMVAAITIPLLKAVQAEMAG
jgi:hypothetical protein